MKEYLNKKDATEKVTILVEKIKAAIAIQQMQERIIDSSIQEIQRLYKEHPDIDNKFYQELIQEDEEDSTLKDTASICI